MADNVVRFAEVGGRYEAHYQAIYSRGKSEWSPNRTVIPVSQALYDERGELVPVESGCTVEIEENGGFYTAVVSRGDAELRRVPLAEASMTTNDPGPPSYDSLLIAQAFASAAISAEREGAYDDDDEEEQP